MKSARVSVATLKAASRVTKNSSELSFWGREEQKWDAMQVGRQGSYSVERLESLDHYCRTTSRVRVIAVCLMTPLPAFTVAVLLDCLPLQHPSAGWAANWAFWIRWTLTFLAISFWGVSQLITYVPGLNFTLVKRWIVSVGSTFAFVVTCLFTAITVKFPVPFMLQLGSIVMGLCIALMVRLVFSKKDFATDSPHRPYFRRFYHFLFAFLVLGGVYPFYRVVFDAAPLHLRGVMILLLPLWKFAAKHFIVKALRELEDFIPELVAFTVDFFSSLFVSACMTTSGSIYLSVMFIFADVAQALVEIHEVKANAKIIIKLLEDRQKANTAESVDLAATILQVTRNPKESRVTCLEAVRLRACLPHPLTEEQKKQLQVLEASGIFGPDVLPSRRRPSLPRKQEPFRWLHPQFGQNAFIVPVASNFAANSKATTNQSTKPKRVETSKKLVEQGLQLLFHCEYLALVEYVECVVPLVFVSYKSILHELPNLVYYTDGAGTWSFVSVVNLLVFSALEVGTFVVFIRFLQHKFAFSPLYQLAFVFETQIYLVQAKLLIEIVLLLQSKLAHFGGGYVANIEK